MSSRQPLKPFSYRVTKYNPDFRGEAGVYLRDEWTAASDVGRVFGGVMLTPETYLKTEAAYVAAVQMLLADTRQPTLVLTKLERYQPLTASWLPAAPRPAVSNGQALVGPLLDAVVRMILQEELWAELMGPQADVNFGYDYYMYFRTMEPLPPALGESIQQLGLHID